MADLAASDVALTIVNKSYDHGHNRINLVQLVVGDGTKLYPAGGYIPLPAFDTAAAKAKYGLHTQMYALEIVEFPIDGLNYKIDRANLRLYIYQTGGVTPAGTNAAENAHTENTAATYAQNATTGAGSSHTHAFTGTAQAAAAMAALGNVALVAKTMLLRVTGK